MAREATIYNTASGINNRVDPTRIAIGKGGVAGLEAAHNVYINKHGGLETVPDPTLEIAGAFHSLYPVSGGFYCVQDRASDSAIFFATLTDGQFALRGVSSGYTLGVKMSFAPLGDRIYFSNGNENGFISGTTAYAWPVNSWTGRDPLSQMTATPAGTHIDVLSGRIIMAVGDEVIFTEYGLPGLYDAIKNRRRFDSDVIMVRSVGTGVYASDGGKTYFLAGNDPNQWTSKDVLPYPATEWGDNPLLVNPANFGLETPQLSLLFNTTRGLCLGLPDGTVFNLTESRYKPTVACAALALFKDSLAVMSGSSKGVMVQGAIGGVTGKAVTEWDGGFDSLLATDDDELVGANALGLHLLWGAVTSTASGLEMLTDLEMLETLEMVS